MTGNRIQTRYFATDPTELGLSVSAMVWRGDELLLMRRSDNGYWGLPGGYVEVGESVADAARREVAEETGWAVEIAGLIGVYSDPATQVVDYSLQTELGSELRTESDADLETRVGTGECQPSVPTGPAIGRGGRHGRVQIVNLCFRAKAVEQGEMTTPEETLEIGFFRPDRLPTPFVPIHSIRIEDGLASNLEAAIR